MQRPDTDFTAEILNIVNSGKDALTRLEEEKSQEEKQKVTNEFFKSTLSTIRKVGAV